jgi:hypothetical protein
MKKILVVLSFLCIATACVPDLMYQKDDVAPVMTLRATFGGGPDTRTVFGRSTTSDSYSEIEWEAGDQIKVFSSNGSAKYTTDKGGITADFAYISGDAPTGGPLLGLSPFDDLGSANLSSKSITSTIPSVQQAIAGSFDPTALLAVGFSSKSNHNMAFYNVCGGICFTLTENVTNYNSIELSGNDGEKVAGAVSISCSSDSYPVVSSLSGSSTSVSLVLPEGESFKKDTKYFLLFRPGVFKNGFKLIFKDSKDAELFTCICDSFVEFKRSTFAYIMGADDPMNLAAICDGDLLSKDGTANSYIVSKEGSYKFPLSRATESEIISGITGVKVLWETDNTSNTQSEGSIITNVSTNKKYVFFETPKTLKNGNALIAACKGSEVVWSWHIWVCAGYDPDRLSQIYTGKDAAMMDRNLGALSASVGDPLTNGLFYQWGRKDPFLGAVEDYVSSPNGGHFMKSTAGTGPKFASVEDVNPSVAYAIAHPDTFFTTSDYWGDWLSSANNELWPGDGSKSIYDPCPAGWKVPRAFVLNSSSQHDTAKEAWSAVGFQRVGSGIYGVYLDLASGGRAWYPNNGYINSSGSLLMVGQYSCYWSCNPNGQFSYAMEMSQSASSLTFNPVCYGKARGVGHSVRCVEDK